jgi:hypothetical protein
MQEPVLTEDISTRKAARKVENTVASKHIVFGPMKNFHTFFVAEHDWIHMTHFEGNLPHVSDT